MGFWYTTVIAEPAVYDFDNPELFRATPFQQIESWMYFMPTSALIFERQDLLDGTRIYRTPDAAVALMDRDANGPFISVARGRYYFSQTDPSTGRAVLREWAPVV